MKRFAVLGHPIGHSFSPVMQNKSITIKKEEYEKVSIFIRVFVYIELDCMGR